MKKLVKEVPDEHLSASPIQKWSRADTDLVFQLAAQFQLNFVVMTDRFNFLKENVVDRFSKSSGSRHSRRCKTE